MKPSHLNIKKSLEKLRLNLLISKATHLREQLELTEMNISNLMSQLASGSNQQRQI